MKKLLIIEDDVIFANGLARSLSRRGYIAQVVNDLTSAKKYAVSFAPQFILLDLQLGLENSQSFVPVLRQLCPQSMIVILTGFGTIPSAVMAVKAGADSYLSKPASIEQIEQAFALPAPKVGGELWQLEQDHIHKVLAACGGNITQAAKTLGLHRRTLQRRLGKN